MLLRNNVCHCSWEVVVGSIQCKTISGYPLVLNDGVIVSITLGGRKIAVGDTVTANGRSGGVSAGTKGVVRIITEPFTGTRTDDVIGVQWGEEEGVTSMKFKDLEE